MAGVALGRDAFHGLQDLKREKVDLPGRGGFVWIREMCAEEILQFFEKSKADSSGTMVWLMAKSVVDESGERLFSDAEAGLLAQSLNREEFRLIQDKVLAINGIGEEAEKK
jgi:hypothetical protein